MGSERTAPPRRKRGRPPRSADERAAQRLRLVEGAMQGIRDGGPDISVDELAQAAGVSKPVLYDEFGGKLGLADAIAVLLAEDLEGGVHDELARAGGFDVEVIVRTVIDGIVDIMVREPELYAFLVRSIRASDRGFLDHALVRVVRGHVETVLGLVAPETRGDNVPILADGLFGFVFAAVESWNATRRPDREELVRSLTSVIATAIAGIAHQRQD